MTVLSGLIAILTQLMGGVATMTVGWAVVLLFGRVPVSRQGLLSSIGLASLVWVVALVCVLVPPAGGLLIAAIPRPGFVPVAWLQVALLAIAVALPLGIGLATVYVVDEGSRPHGLARVQAVLRGYPYAAVLAGTIVFLALLRLHRRLRSLRRGWHDEHLAFIVKPGRYAAVVSDMAAALWEAGLPVVRQRAPRVVEVPPRLLALVGGPSAGEIPDELVELRLDSLAILVYPSDIAVVGPSELVARARSAMARQLAFTDAYLTTAKESEQVEDRLAEISRRGFVSAADFHPIDEILACLPIPHDDWETLYRLRLQVENETRFHEARRAASEP
jgi:hypothetical protein